jgi:hypothetical protein
MAGKITSNPTDERDQSPRVFVVVHLSTVSSQTTNDPLYGHVGDLQIHLTSATFFFFSLILRSSQIFDDKLLAK